METSATDLFERYSGKAYRYFLRVTGRPDLAEDLVQELFLRAVKHLGAGRTEGDTKWLFGIARNLVVDHWRKSVPPHVPLATARDLHTPATQVVAFGVWEALGLLSPQDRDLVLLREVTGLSYTDLAEVCETTVENVRSRMSRARGRLRALLGRRLSARNGLRRNEHE
jgi:RNA polymerase sigma-70 factor (ECF subfamily)